jgi:hypothetical protein
MSRKDVSDNAKKLAVKVADQIRKQVDPADVSKVIRRVAYELSVSVRKPRKTVNKKVVKTSKKAKGA